MTSPNFSVGLPCKLAAAIMAAVLLVSTAAAAAADAPASRPDGSTPLQWAVFEGNLAEVKRLLAAGADPKAINDYGVDAIQLAADESNTELIRLLLKAGANPNSANADGETVLHLVARSGNLDAAKLLANAGALADPRERFGGQTPGLDVGRPPGAIPTSCTLPRSLERSPDVNARSAVRDYARIVTAESRAKQLDRGGFTPLMYAARENCRECLPVLLKYHADLTLPDPSGLPPLSIALMNGNWDLAKRLIEAGSDVNQWDYYGQGPLNVAIVNETVHGNGNPLDRDVPDHTTAREVVKMLVERGANPNQQLYYQAVSRTILGADTGRGTTPVPLGLRQRRHRDRETAACPRRQSAARHVRWPGPHHPRDHRAHRRQRLSECAHRRGGGAAARDNVDDVSGNTERRQGSASQSHCRASSGCWPPAGRM